MESCSSSLTPSSVPTSSQVTHDTVAMPSLLAMGWTAFRASLQSLSWGEANYGVSTDQGCITYIPGNAGMKIDPSMNIHHKPLGTGQDAKAKTNGLEDKVIIEDDKMKEKKVKLDSLRMK